jgi:hypothetical protein
MIEKICFLELKSLNLQVFSKPFEDSPLEILFWPDKVWANSAD